MRYLTYSELIFINGRILNNQKIQNGMQKIRDIDGLLSAEQRPQSSVFGQDAYPTLVEKVGALLHSLAKNHPFTDGNKRSSVVSAVFMLEVNGYEAYWQPEEALHMILDMTAGRKDLPDFVHWLNVHETHTPSLEPDLEHDTAHIDRIITQHRWLLDELAKQ
jgi:death on curing protein